MAENNTKVGGNIDLKTTIPKGVNIISFHQDVRSPMILGLGTDNNIYSWYNGEWKLFTINFTVMNDEETTTPEEEIIPEETVAPEAEHAPENPVAPEVDEDEEEEDDKPIE